MKVKKFMTADPVVIDQSQPIHEAKRLLEEHRFRHLPIVDDGKVVGILSDRDIIRTLAISESVMSFCGIDTRDEVYIRDIMADQVIYLTPEDHLKDAARIMEKHKIGCLPVVENGSLVGIITATDILKVFSEMMEYIGQ